MRRRARGLLWSGAFPRLAALGAGVAAVAVTCALAAPSGGPLAPAEERRPAAPGPVHRQPQQQPGGGMPEAVPVALRTGGQGGAPPLAITAGTEFTSTVTPVTREQVTHSWRPGCPVHWRDLRLIRATHWGFDQRPHTGAIVVHRTLAEDVVRILKRLFYGGYPIARMQLVDVYEADDDRSMAANNTSAFNCRPVAGTDSWSEHSYGRAVDVNPVQNPYVSASGNVSPPAGERYADRSLQELGMIHDGDETVAAFAELGWEWGGHWQSARDYQHFSTTGR